MTKSSVTWLFVHVMPAHHSTAHGLDSLSQQISDYEACARNCFFDKILQTGPVAHVLRLTINHHVVPRLWVCGAWPSSIKGNTQLQFLLVSLWNRHRLSPANNTAESWCLGFWPFVIIHFTIVISAPFDWFQHIKIWLTRSVCPLSPCLY
jgi:hypothetical protein